MARINGTILIHRPVEMVFDYVADQTHEPTYNPRMSASTKLTPGPIGPGTRFHATVTTRGRPLDMDIEVTDYDRPTRISTRSDMSSAQVNGTLTFVPSGANTQMSWAWDVKPDGVARFLGPLIKMMGRRQEQAIWSGLKTRLEADTPLTPGEPG